MSVPEAEPEIQTKSRWGCGCLGLLMLLVGYILSPVPLVLMIGMMPLNVQEAIFPVWRVFCWPLQWCYEHSPTVAAFYDWYANVFDL